MVCSLIKQHKLEIIPNFLQTKPNVNAKILLNTITNVKVIMLVLLKPNCIYISENIFCSNVPGI